MRHERCHDLLQPILWTARPAGLQIGPRIPGMSRVTQQSDSRGRAPPPQLQRKHQVRQLGLTVGLPWRVCCFPLQVIEIDPLHAHVCGSARNSCNSRGLRALECWHQQGCQREWPQEVGPELQLEAIGRQLALRHRHYPCVVYEEIQLRLTIDPLGKCPHRSQICQVERLEMYFGRRELAPDTLDRIATLRL